LNDSSKVVARYNNDQILIAEKLLNRKLGFGRVLALNSIGVNNGIHDQTGWQKESDGYILISSCLQYVSGMYTPPKL